MKLETKYKQTKEHMEKVRSRTSSKGSIDSSDKQSPKAEDGTNSPFRLFKGGDAMKIFQEKALGQVSLQEKEAKEKQAFQDAAVQKKEAIMAYKAYTNGRIDKFTSQDIDGWDELKKIIEELLRSTKDCKEARHTAIEKKLSHDVENSYELLPRDVDEWIATVKERIQQNEKSAPQNEEGVALSPAKSLKTDNVEKILAMTGNEEELPELIRDNDIEPKKTSDSFDSVKSTPSTTDAKVKEGNLPEEQKTSAVTNQESSRDSLDMNAFLKQFWSNKPESESPPDILMIFTCSYRPKNKAAFLAQNLNGRCFTTTDKLYFLAYDNKNFFLDWKDFLKVEKERKFIGSTSGNSLAITYQSEGMESIFSLTRLESVSQIADHLQTLMKASKKDTIAEKSMIIDSGNSLPEVEPDKLLDETEIVVSKTIKNISIKKLFENVWADTSPDKKTFYGSWLEDEECFDITVNDWEFAETGTFFTNAWCKQYGEQYTQRRLVTFKFKRTSHLYIGPPIAVVKQLHNIRVEGNDKIVLAIEATFEGIPYSDTFGVEMRWVARRVGANDVQVDVGLFVLFKKSTMLKSQIKSGTISETKNVHLRLFNAVKKACAVQGEPQAEDEEEEVTLEVVKAEPGFFATIQEKFPSIGGSTAVYALGLFATIFFGRYFLSAAFGSVGQNDIQRLESQISDLQEEVRAMQKSLDRIVDLLNEK
jgi:hypothetical protein